MKRVLITGAAGSVGSFLRDTLRGRFQLRLADLRQIESLAEDEEFVAADVTDLAAVGRLVEGVDAIVHLGSISREAAWEPTFQTNFGGTYNVYEAARQHGKPRVIFASSNHAIGFYPRTQRIGVDERVRPDSRYGVSKAFGEALGSLYADKYGVKGMGIRIGNVSEAPVDVRRLSIWISPRDLAQLVAIGVDHPDVHYEIVYGMSDNARGWWDNSNAERLGYRPQDRSEDHADSVLAAAPPPDPGSLAERLQGGDFTVVEEGGGAPLMK